MTSLQPLPLDILELLGILCLGVVAFFLGLRNSRLPQLVRRFNIAVAVTVIAYLGCMYAGLLPLDARRIIYYLGGPKVVLSLIALFLLGVSWHEPRRSFTPSFLEFLIGVAGIILFIDSSGPLYWRLIAADTWKQVADENGRLQQSTVMTCGPAAAVMLLNKIGIESSEGEMAYLSRTSFFGTDGFALSRALDRKVRDKGWSAAFHKTDYAYCLETKLPFIATVRGAGLVSHAEFVEFVHPDFVTIIDPSGAERKRIERKTFEEIWNGEAVHVFTSPK